MFICRGCGDSDGDDYAPPHTIQNAAEDVLTLVQAACAFPYTKQPFVIVAYGTLGKALAHYYADWTINQGGVTANTHSEVSGEGAVIPPEHIVLLSLPNLTSAGADFITGTSNMSGSVDCTLGTEDSIKYTFDRAICEEMLTDAGRYLALQENTFQRVAADSVLEAEKACTTGGVGVIKKLAHGRKPLQVIECSDYDSVISYVLKCVDEAK